MSKVQIDSLTDEGRDHIQNVLETVAKAVTKAFNRIKDALKSFIETLTKSSIEQNTRRIKQFEKRGTYLQIKTAFILPFVQKRYEDVVTALKYARHSRKRERLLKTKAMYEKLI